MTIMKAVKEGRTPESGLPGQENGFGNNSNGNSSVPSIPASPSSSTPLPTTPSAPPTVPIMPPSAPTPAPVATAPVSTPTPAQSIQGAPTSGATSSTRPPSSLQHAPQLSSEINDSIELALFGVKALKSNDKKVGADRLREALKRLGL